MKLGWRKLLPASLVNILATGLIVLALQGASGATARTLRLLGDLSMALIAVSGVALLLFSVVFLLQPAKKRRFLLTSSAQYAAAMGGTPTAKMEA
jgi:NADH-quinone oxidoreductase subunit H